MSFREALSQLRSRSSHLKGAARPNSSAQTVNVLPKSTPIDEIEDELGLNDEDLLRVALAVDDQFCEDVPKTPTCPTSALADSKENNCPKAFAASSSTSAVDKAKQSAAIKLRQFSFHPPAKASSRSSGILQEDGAPPAKVRPSRIDVHGALSPAVEVTARRTNGLLSPVTSTITYSERHCVASSSVQTPSSPNMPQPTVAESASPALPSSPRKRSFSFVRSSFGSPDLSRPRSQSVQPRSSLPKAPKAPASTFDSGSHLEMSTSRTPLATSSHLIEHQGAGLCNAPQVTAAGTREALVAREAPVAKGFTTPQRKMTPIAVTPSTPVKQTTTTPGGSLHSTPSVSGEVRIPQLGSRGSAPTPRRFPGPAGALPRLLPGQQFESVRLPTTPHAASPIICQTKADPVSNNASSMDDVFQSSAWVAMLTSQGRSLEDGAHFLAGGIKSLLHQASTGCLPGGKANHLFTVIRSFSSSSMDASVTLADPTGEMQGTIHHKALEELPHDLCVGCVLVLRHVSMFSPTPRRHYLNIIPDNMVHVFWPEINRSSQSCGVRSYHRPECDRSPPPRLADRDDAAMKPTRSHHLPQFQTRNGAVATSIGPGRPQSNQPARGGYMPSAAVSLNPSTRHIYAQRSSAVGPNVIKETTPARSDERLLAQSSLTMQNELTAAEIEALDPGMLDAVMCDDELFTDIT